MFVSYWLNFLVIYLPNHSFACIYSNSCNLFWLIDQCTILHKENFPETVFFSKFSSCSFNTLFPLLSISHIAPCRLCHRTYIMDWSICTNISAHITQSIMNHLIQPFLLYFACADLGGDEVTGWQHRGKRVWVVEVTQMWWFREVGERKKKGKNGILESLEVQQAKNWCIK